MDPVEQHSLATGYLQTVDPGVEAEQEEADFSSPRPHDQGSSLYRRAPLHVCRGGGSGEPLIEESTAVSPRRSNSLPHVEAAIIEEIQCDPVPNVAMEVSDDEGGDPRLSHLPHVVLPTQWPTLPSECKHFTVREGNELMHVVQTNGDGACSMHSLWGFPSASAERAGDVELYADNVRVSLMSQIPRRWLDVCSLHAGHLQTHLEGWVNEKCFGLFI